MIAKINNQNKESNFFLPTNSSPSVDELSIVGVRSNKLKNLLAADTDALSCVDLNKMIEERRYQIVIISYNDLKIFKASRMKKVKANTLE